MTRLFAFTSAAGISFAVVALFVTETAQAKQCNISVPSNPHGHWSYRFIDGRKCWYEGENNYSKSLLQWPAQSPALPEESITASGKRDSPPDSVVKESDNFENRWSGIRR